MKKLQPNECSGKAWLYLRLKNNITDTQFQKIEFHTVADIQFQKIECHKETDTQFQKIECYIYIMVLLL